MLCIQMYSKYSKSLCVLLMLSDVSTERMTENMETRDEDEDEANDDNHSNNSDPPAPTAFQTSTLRRKFQ